MSILICYLTILAAQFSSTMPIWETDKQSEKTSIIAHPTSAHQNFCCTHLNNHNTNRS